LFEEDDERVPPPLVLVVFIPEEPRRFLCALEREELSLCCNVFCCWVPFWPPDLLVDELARGGRRPREDVVEPADVIWRGGLELEKEDIWIE